jgi:hypothetical protein
MPRAKGSQAEVQKLAKEFAGQITDLIAARMADEVEAKVAAILDHITDAGESVFGRPLRIVRPQGGKIVVRCPVPGCKNPGVRPKRNFCLQHAESLSAAEKNRYRQAQIAQKGGGKRSKGNEANGSQAKRRAAKAKRRATKGATKSGEAKAAEAKGGEGGADTRGAAASAEAKGGEAKRATKRRAKGKAKGQAQGQAQA